MELVLFLFEKFLKKICPSILDVILFIISSFYNRNIDKSRRANDDKLILETSKKGTIVFKKNHVLGGAYVINQSKKSANINDIKMTVSKLNGWGSFTEYLFKDKIVLFKDKSFFKIKKDDRRFIEFFEVTKRKKKKNWGIRFRCADDQIKSKIYPIFFYKIHLIISYGDENESIETDYVLWVKRRGYDTIWNGGLPLTLDTIQEAIELVPKNINAVMKLVENNFSSHRLATFLFGCSPVINHDRALFEFICYSESLLRRKEYYQEVISRLYNSNTVDELFVVDDLIQKSSPNMALVFVDSSWHNVFLILGQGIIREPYNRPLIRRLEQLFSYLLIRIKLIFKRNIST